MSKLLELIDKISIRQVSIDLYKSVRFIDIKQLYMNNKIIKHNDKFWLFCLMQMRV